MRLMLMLPLPLPRPRPSSGGWLNNLRQFLDILSAANTHTHTYIETEPQTGPVYRNRTGYMRESSSSPRPAYVFHVYRHIFPFLVSSRFASIEVKTKLNPELYVPVRPFTSLHIPSCGLPLHCSYRSSRSDRRFSSEISLAVCV